MSKTDLSKFNESQTRLRNAQSGPDAQTGAPQAKNPLWMFKWKDKERSRAQVKSRIEKLDDDGAGEKAGLLSELAKVDEAAGKELYEAAVKGFEALIPNVDRVEKAALKVREEKKAKAEQEAAEAKRRLEEQKLQLEGELQQVQDPPDAAAYQERLVAARKVVTEALGKGNLDGAREGLKTLRKEVSDVEALVKADQERAKEKLQLEGELQQVQDPPDAAAYRERLDKARKTVTDALGTGDLDAARKGLKTLRDEVADVADLVADDQEAAQAKSLYEQEAASLDIQNKIAEAKKIAPVTAKLKKLRNELVAAEAALKQATEGATPNFDLARRKCLPDLDDITTDMTLEKNELELADLEFQDAWKVLLPRYNEAKKVLKTDHTTTAIDEMEAAYNGCAEATNAYNFKKAKLQVEALEAAIVEVEQKQAEEQSDETLYWDENSKMEGACKYDQTVKSAGELRDLMGDALEATETGRLAKVVLDLRSRDLSLFSAKAFKAGAAQMPLIIQAVKAVQDKLEPLKDHIANCKSAWEALQGDYNAASKTPVTSPTVAQHLKAMNEAYAEVKGKLDGLEIDQATINLIQNELKPNIELVKQDATAHDLLKAPYDTALKDNATWFRYGRDYMKNFKAPLPKLAAAMIEAETKFAAIEEKAKKFDYSGAIGLLNPGFQNQDMKIYTALEMVLASEKVCKSKFTSEVDAAHENIVAGAGSPELLKLAKARDKALADYNAAYKAGEFDEALATFIPALKKAAKDLIDAAATQNSTARPKTDAAKQKVNQLIADGQLEMRPQGEKVQLLKDLQGVGAKLSDDEQKAQGELFKTLKLDEKFLKQDKTRRQAVVDNIVANPKDKKEFQDGRDKWGTMDVKRKMDLLVKAHKGQCATLKINPIPVLPVEQDPSDLGAYSPSERVINVNTASSGFRTNFAKVMDTLFHETMHWNQANLVENFNNGKIKEDDPDYEQVQMFALNDNRPDAYMSSATGKRLVDDTWGDEVYRKQPQEAHAYDAGPDMAKMLMKALG